MIRMKIIRCGIKTKEERSMQGGNKSSMMKDSIERMRIEKDGCGIIGRRDYNNYRSISKVLKGTNDRAVSIVTEDIYEELNRMGGK